MNTPADRLANFGFLVKDIGRLYTKLFEAEAEPLGINLAEAKVLAALSRHAGLNQVQLGEISGIEPMSLVRILDRMETDRWIERRPHPTDRRARHIHLKEKAQPTLDAIWKVVAQIRMQALAEFSSAERNLLIEQLARVHYKMVQMLNEQTAGDLPNESSPRKLQTGERTNRLRAPTKRLSRTSSKRKVVMSRRNGR